jgi:hypothetical protein
MKGYCNLHIRLLLTTFVALCITCSLSGQSNPQVKNFEILVDTYLVDTIESLSGWPNPKLVYQAGADYTLESSTEIGTNLFELVISFDPGVMGNKSLVVEYLSQGQNFFPDFKYTVFEIDIFPSIVRAADDIVIKTSDSLVIYPAMNDYSSLGEHELTSINQTKYGNSIIQGDSIIYTGTDEEDVILYTIQDSIGTSDQGVIFITSDDQSFSGSDTLNYMITNAQEKLLLLPNVNFSLDISPSNGSVSEISSIGSSYLPNEGFVGTDEMTFSDGYGNSRTYIITVLDAIKDDGYVKDDQVFTAQEETVEFDVYQNDLLKSGILLSYSSELTLVSPGVFSYTPPTDFVGQKLFFYEKDFGVVIETGSIVVNVGNFDPTKEFPYAFNVLEDKDFFVEYSVPINGYSFTIVNSPQHGIATTYSENDTFTSQCNEEISGRVGINYIPDAGYTGYDEFNVEYCINGGQCEFYKLRFNVYTPNDASVCNCVEDCVWEGDANADGRVSVTDLMSVGRYMGYGGTTRSVTDQGLWNGESSADWNFDQINGANTNHIDGNNDGVITEDDLTAIADNYGQVHSLVTEEVLAIKDYPFYLMPNQTELDSGDLLIIQISLGNSNYPVEDVHGLAFGLNIPPGLIDSASFEMEMYDNTWFTIQSPTLDMNVHKQDGKIDVGYTRTTGIGISGYGIIGQLSFIVEEDIHGIKSDELLTRILQHIYLQDATMEDTYGNKFRVPDAVASFEVLLENKIDPTEDKLVLYPNPASDRFTLHFNGNNTIFGVSVYDMTGRLLHQDLNIEQQRYEVNTQRFHPGVHIVKCNTSKGVITKKVTINR